MRRIRHGTAHRLGLPGRTFRSKRLGNPLFANVRGRGGRNAELGRRARLAALFAVPAILVAGVGWLLFWSPYFRIKNVTVTGASAATESGIRSIINDRLGRSRLLLLPQAGIFAFDKSGALRDISAKYFLDSLDLNKKLPGGLTIDVKEKTTRAAFLIGNRFLAVDELGFVLRDLAAPEIEALGELPPGFVSAPVSELGAQTVEIDTAKGAAADANPPNAAPVKNNDSRWPLIVDAGQGGMADQARDLKAGDAAVSSAAVALILQAYARLPDIAGSRVRWFTVQKGSETVEADMEGGWRIFLTSALPFDVQGSRLSLVLKEKIGGQKSSLDYLDLRYDARVFYRLKTAPPPTDKK